MVGGEVWVVPTLRARTHQPNRPTTTRASRLLEHWSARSAGSSPTDPTPNRPEAARTAASRWSLSTPASKEALGRDHPPRTAPEECAAVIQRLGDTPGLRIHHTSPIPPHRRAGRRRRHRHLDPPDQEVNR
jgi:hypothetical protein